jgi:hypothetical protein
MESKDLKPRIVVFYLLETTEINVWKAVLRGLKRGFLRGKLLKP